MAAESNEEPVWTEQQRREMAAERAAVAEPALTVDLADRPRTPPARVGPSPAATPEAKRMRSVTGAAGPAAAGAGDAPGDAPIEEAPVDLLTPAQWGQHLRADYLHDELNPTIPYNIGGNTDAARHQKEDGTVKEFSELEFFEYAKRLKQDDPTFQSRLNSMVSFTVPVRTGTYAQKAPPFTQVGNENIGIITDNGEFMTHDYFGAMHVVSFGNVFDPAGTPITPKDQPIYYKSGENPNIYIDLQQFGFAPERIRGVWVADISGGKYVRSAWVNGEYQVLDPMTAPGGNATKETIPAAVRPNIPSTDLYNRDWVARNLPIPKTINVVGGLYASIGTSASDNKKIGKTLGDTMIVASAMSDFIRYDLSGNPFVPNVFYGANNRDGWKDLNKDSLTYYGGRIPQLLAVKTGDILCAVRAIFKNVPVIFERKETKTKPRHIECYPSKLSEEQIRSSIPVLYDKLILDVGTRYTNLIQKFQEMLVTGSEPAQLNTGYSLFRPNDYGTWSAWRDTRADVTQRLRAALVVQRIISTLTDLKEKVEAYFKSEKNKVLPRRRERVEADLIPLDELFRRYRISAQEMLALTPQTDETVRYEEADNPDRRFMRLIIPITRISKEGIEGPTEIYLYSAFRAIHETENDERLAENPYWKVFDERFPLRREGGMRGGAVTDKEYGEVINEHLLIPDLSDDLVSDTIKLNETVIDNTGDNDNPFLLPADSVPMTMAFVEYCTGVPPIESLNRLDRLCNNANNGYVMENSMLRTIKYEFERMMYDYLVLEDIPISGSGGGAQRTVPPPTPIDILWFNAFTSHINNKNEIMYRQRDDRIRFDYIETGLVKKLGEYLRGTPPSRKVEVTSTVSSPGQNPKALTFTPAGRGPTERGSDPRPSARVSELLTMAPGSTDVSGDESREQTQTGTGHKTPRRKNRKSTYRLQKKHRK